MTTLNLMRDVSNVIVGEFHPAGDSSETLGVRSVQAGVLGTGAVSATIKISGANDTRFPMDVVTFTLSGTNIATDAVEITFPWENLRAEIVAISGTGATASVTLRT